MEEEISHAIVFADLVVCLTEDGRDLLDEIFALAKAVTRKQLSCDHKFGGKSFGSPVLFIILVRHFDEDLTFNIR